MSYGGSLLIGEGATWLHAIEPEGTLDWGSTTHIRRTGLIACPVVIHVERDKT